MSIINQKYGKIIINSIKNALSKEIDLLDVGNYVDFINCLDEFLSNIIRESIRKSFESINQEYKHSKRRKELYLYERTIL